MPNKPLVRKVPVPVRQRVRDNGNVVLHLTNVSGGHSGSIVTYNVNFTATAAGIIKFMVDWTGTYRTYSEKHQVFTERPMDYTQIEWRPYQVNGSKRYSYQTPSNGGWETVSGQPVSLIFGNPMPTSNSLAMATAFAPVDPTRYSRIGAEVTTDCWKRVDPSQAATLVSGIEAHKSIRLLLSKGRGLVSLIEAAKRGEGPFRTLLTSITGIDVRRQPIPKRILVWDSSGNPIVNKRGKPLVRFGRYKWVDRTEITAKAAQLLLEYRYGWKIMVMEIVDQLKAFNADALRNELTLRYREDYQVSRATKSESYVSVTPLTGVFGGITYTGELVEETTIECRAWVKWRLKEDQLFRRLNDYGMFDLSRSAWDIIPYSFVIDMLVDVSGYLQAIDNYMKANVLTSGYTFKTTREFTRRVNTNNGATFKWPPIVANGTSETATVITKHRSSPLGIPAHPTVQVKLNLYNVATLTALLKTGQVEARRLRV